MFKKFRRNSAVTRLIEEQLYEQVTAELDQGIRRTGLWGKAVANSGGDENKTLALYMKLRVQSLRDEAEIGSAIIEEGHNQRQLDDCTETTQENKESSNTKVSIQKAKLQADEARQKSKREAETDGQKAEYWAGKDEQKAKFWAGEKRRKEKLEKDRGNFTQDEAVVDGEAYKIPEEENVAKQAVENSVVKSNSWGWIWASIVGIIIIKLFGIAGGLVTIAAYYWLQPKVGTWGSVVVSGVLGVAAVVGLNLMLFNPTSKVSDLSSTSNLAPKVEAEVFEGKNNTEGIDIKGSPTQSLSEKDLNYTINIIQAFKELDKEKISNLIAYPLRRAYPIPDIANRAEFLLRFDQVFDHKLIEMISNSNPNEDWSRVGWRGVMLNSGVLWFNDGLISGINHQSSIEQHTQELVIEKQKTFLHESVNTFNYPILDWKTEKYHIRIDNVGNDVFRYAAWDVGMETTSKPNIILHNGQLEHDGSGGNHNYIFTNGDYTYRCEVTVLGNNIGLLNVLKGNKVLLSEQVIESN